MKDRFKKMKFQNMGVEFDFLISSDETIISKNIENNGSWEENQLQLYDTLIHEDGVFIDVGANVGINSIFASIKKPNAKIFSIEASYDNYKLLEKNINLNKISNIKPFNIAISNTDGEVYFSGSGTNAKLSDDKSGDKVLS